MIVINENYKPNAYRVVGAEVLKYWEANGSKGYKYVAATLVKLEQSYDGNDWDKVACVVWDDDYIIDEETNEVVPHVMFEWDWNEGQRYIRNLEICYLKDAEIPGNKVDYSEHCPYCDIEKYKQYSDGDWWEGIPLGGYEESIGSGDLELNPVDKVIAADSGVYFVKIKYCPMCGREL